MSLLIPDGSALVSPQSIAEFTAGSKTGTKHQAIVICDSAGNVVDTLTSAPAGTENGLVTRNIPSGTQNVSQNDLTTTGTIAANGQSVVLALSGGATTAYISITGTWAGTLFYQTSGDGTNWISAQASYVFDGTIFASTIVNRDVMLPVAGAHSVRVLCTSWTSGTANVAIRASQGASATQLTHALPTGTNSIGNIGNPVTSPAGVRLSDGTAALTTTGGRLSVDASGVAVPLAPSGYTTYTGTVGATATAVKASAGTLHGWHLYNSNAAAIYVQLFDLATGSVTLGTTAPKMSVGIPPTSGANVEFVNGISFATAITYACTTTREGNTAPTNTVDTNFLYK